MSRRQDAVSPYDRSLAADPGHRYAPVIAWMGYEAPHGFSGAASSPAASAGADGMKPAE